MKACNSSFYDITGQSIPIPHSEPLSHLRCGNGSQTYLNLYICSELYIS